MEFVTGRVDSAGESLRVYRMLRSRCRRGWATQSLIALGGTLALGGCEAEPETGPTGGPLPGAPSEIDAVPALNVGVLGGDS